MISDRARRLVEALHEPFTNEQRWEIAQEFLNEERMEAIQDISDFERAFKFERKGIIYGYGEGEVCPECGSQHTEGTAQQAGQPVLKTVAPNGVESSTLSPSATSDNDRESCGCRWNSEGFEHGA